MPLHSVRRAWILFGLGALSCARRDGSDQVGHRAPAGSSSAPATPSTTPPPAASASAGPDAAVIARGEPAYCDPEVFRHLEVPMPSAEASRLHAFRIGAVTLAGMAVGNSRVEAVEDVARELSTAGPDEKYCTWYYNVRNPEAARVFNHHPVLASPIQMRPAEATETFLQVVAPSFDQGEISVISCVERFGYVALGCDAQQHRGPTAFAMLLAFSGCTPEHAVAIVDGLWGLNGVPLEVRTAVARAGYDLGQQRPESRRRLQAKLTQPAPADAGVHAKGAPG